MILNQNKLSTIEQIGDMFPKLETLSLISNQISNLNEITKLSKCTKLVRLYLFHNSIVENPEYRIFVISRIPSLKILDFQKVKQSEKEEALRIYGSYSAENQMTFLSKLSKKEKIKLLIERTKGLEQLNRLEMLLKSGELSEDFLNNKLMEFKLI